MKKKGTPVSRSVYQKLAEENKRLRRDIEIIVMGSMPESILKRAEWKKVFEKELAFNRMMKEYATEYFKNHPEEDIMSPNFVKPTIKKHRI